MDGFPSDGVRQRPSWHADARGAVHPIIPVLAGNGAIRPVADLGGQQGTRGYRQKAAVGGMRQRRHMRTPGSLAAGMTAAPRTTWPSCRRCFDRYGGDLNSLCNRNSLTRVHGGAVILSSVQTLSYEARRTNRGRIQTGDRRGGGGARARSSSLSIDIGTTTKEVVHERRGRLVAGF